MFMLNSPNSPFRLEEALSWQGFDLSKLEDLLLGSQNKLPSSSQHQPKTLVFLSRTGYPLEKALSLQAFYSRMRLIWAVHGNLEVYPPEEEFLFKEDKVGDVRRLDLIAQAASDPMFGYRPRTCFGLGPCTLSPATLANPADDSGEGTFATAIRSVGLYGIYSSIPPEITL